MKRFEQLIEGPSPGLSLYCLFVILWAVTGCDSKNSKQLGQAAGYGVSEFTHDDCQYLIVGGTGIIHKANCKNPIHKCEK